MKKRMLAMFLCLAMLVTALPVSALADVLPFSRKNQEQQRQQVLQNALLAEQQQNNMPTNELRDKLLATALPNQQEDIIIHTADGDIDYDATWQNAYPYGAFAFDATDGTIYEGGVGGDETLLIPVYRIGGLSGRATAYIAWAAPVYENEDGTKNDTMALSFMRDATLEVENSDPAAFYQRLSAPPMLPTTEGVTITMSEEIVYEDDGEACPTGVRLFAALPDGTPFTADSYVWQTREIGGSWRPMIDSNTPDMKIDLKDTFLDDGTLIRDYRLVYEKNGERFCTPTFCTDDVYDPAEDAERPVPANLPAYEPMTFETYYPESLYENAQIELTFGDGEFVKYLRVTALEESEYSVDRFGVFSIVDCCGGELCSSFATYTLARQDNDQSERSETDFSFMVSEIYADCDNGNAELIVCRNGDLRYPVTVKAETKDGTAIAGEHYTHTEQELAFAGGTATATLTVPLIAGEAFDDDKYFTVELSDPFGGGDLSSVSEQNVATVHLTSSGEVMQMSSMGLGNGLLPDDLNLSSVLSTSNGTDATSLFDIKTDGIIKEKESYDYAQQNVDESLSGKYNARSMNSFTYQNGLQFRRKDVAGALEYEKTNMYWKDKELAAGDKSGYSDSVEYRYQATKPTFEKNGNDLVEGCGPKAQYLPDNGDYHVIAIEHNDNTTGWELNIKDAGKLFSHAYMYFWRGVYGVARYDEDDDKYQEKNYRLAMPWVSVNQYPNAASPKDAEDYYDFEPRYWNENSPGGLPGWRHTFDRDLNFSEDLNIHMGIALNRNGENLNPSTCDGAANANTHLQVSNIDLTRRVFTATSTIGVTIHTANDNDLGVKNPIDLKSSFYDSIRPTVTLVPHKAGVNTKGQLYVGSQLRVEMGNTGAYKMYVGDKADETVFITRDVNGKQEKVPVLVEKAADSEAFLVTLLWDDMTADDLKSQFTVNVVLERRQKVQLDVRPSIERDANGAISSDPVKIREAWNRVLVRKDGKDAVVHVKRGKKIADPPYFKDVEEEDILLKDMLKEGATTILFGWDADMTKKNIQTINFGMDHSDTILFNGRQFAGDDTIMLELQDLSPELLNFILYDEAYAGLESVMETTISQEQLFFDGNGNGRIDGSFDAYTGFFTLDPDSGDSYYGEVADDVLDTDLSPELNAEGKLCQYFLRTFYTMTPRALRAKSGEENKTAQVLPTLISSITDESARFALTDEQASYRPILASATKVQSYDPMNKKREAEPHDVPISSDCHAMFGAPATQMTYVDTPLGGNTIAYKCEATSDLPEITDFKGNLRVKLQNPQAIYHHLRDGREYPVSDLNGYLGAFQNNTTYALYTQEQRTITKLEDVVPESISIGGVTAITDGDATGEMGQFDQMDVGFSSSNGEGPELGKGLDFKDNFMFPAGDVSLGCIKVTSLNGNQLLASINIPLFEAEHKLDQTQKNKDGSETVIKPNGDKYTTKKEVVGEGDDAHDVTVKEFIDSDTKSTSQTEDGKYYDQYSVYTDRYDPQTDVHTYTKEVVTGPEYTLSPTGTRLYQGGSETRMPGSHIESMPPEKKNVNTSGGLSVRNKEAALKNFGGVDLTQLKSFSNWSDFKNNLMNNKEYKEARDGHTNTTKFTASVSFKLAVLFERNNLTGEWSMKRASIGLVGAFAFSFQHRFVVFPPAYFFVRVNLNISVDVDFDKKQFTDNDDPNIRMDGSNVTCYRASYSGTTWEIRPGGYITFKIRKSDNVNGFMMDLDGNVNMIVSKNPEFTDIATRGPHSASDMGIKVNLGKYDDVDTLYVMLRHADENEASDKDPAVVKNLTTNKLYMSFWHKPDIRLTIELSVSVGLGIGCSMANIEAFVNALGKFTFDHKNGNFGPTSILVGAALQIAYKFFFLSGKIELVGHYWEWTRARVEDNWNYKDYWVKFNKQDENLFSSMAGYDGEDAPAQQTPLSSGQFGYSMPTLSTEQTFYAANRAEEEPMFSAFPGEEAYDAEEPLFAYHPTDPEAHFDISGYAAGGDAFKLADHLDTGSSFIPFSYNGNTYILYQIAVPEAGNAFNAYQIALSRVKTQGAQQGILNPIDPESPVPYILVSGALDPSRMTGTNEFSYSLDGSTLNVVWTGYDQHFADDVQLAAEEVSSHVLVYSASVDLEGDQGFTAPVIRSLNSPIYRYLTAMQDNIAVYAETVSTSANPMRDTIEREYLKARYGVTDEELNTGIVPESHPEHQEPAAKYFSNRPLKVAYGDGARLVAALPDGTRALVDVGTVNGEYLTDLVFDNVDGRYVAFYVTDQDIYVSPDGRYITSGFDTTTEPAVIHRLYARELIGNQWQEAKLLYNAVDFAECNRDNIETRTLKDGVYSNTALVNAVVDPTVNSLKILNADLDGTGVKSVFVFGLNDNAYIVRHESLLGILDGQKISAEPLFDSLSGGDVSLASDNEGNMVLSYISPVEGSKSNGIYCTWWDKTLGTWGEPFLLALNRMTVLEDAQKYGLDGADLEKAFLGEQTGNEDYNEHAKTLDPRDRGAYDCFNFSNLYVLPTKVITERQDNEVPADYQGDQAPDVPLSEAEEHEQLIILSNGIYSQLESDELVKVGTEEVIGEGIRKTGDEGKGIYAICFGSGAAAVEKEYVSLTANNFTVGSVLGGEVGFTNVGSTAIRGSGENPITAELIARDPVNGSSVLATWTINDMIPSGADIKLNLCSTPLTQTLADGTELVLSLSEDTEYITQSGGTPFSHVSEPILTIGGCPDIGIEDATFKLASADGDRILIDVDFTVTNRGQNESEDQANANAARTTADVDNLFVQFTYYDAEGNVRPLDVTGSDIKTGEQTPIKKLMAVSPGNQKNGIIELRDENGDSDLFSEYQRHVTGTLSVSREAFIADQDQGLTLGMTVFSNADNYQTSDGLIERLASKEIHLTNNSLSGDLPHRTFFNVPSQTCLSLHNNLNTVVTYTTTKDESNIVVREISNGEQDWQPILDVLYYDVSHGAIVATAKTTGTTVIQLEDTETASFCEIVLIVSDSGKGTNVYKDDYQFDYYDANGVKQDTGVEGAWSFLSDLKSWKGDPNNPPMRADLSVAVQPNAYLEFDTYAAYISFVGAGGKIQISSDLSGTMQPIKEGEASPSLDVSFNNSAGKKHRVRLKALDAEVQIDYLLATYPEDTGTLDRSSEYAPMFYWNRSFPNTASVKNGDSVPLTCYITTPTKLEKVVWNGVDVTADSRNLKQEGPLWTFTTTITKNGTNTLEAYDIEGNRTVATFPVYWFADDLSYNATAECPAMPELHFAERNAIGSKADPQKLYNGYSDENAALILAQIFDENATVYTPECYTNGFEAIQYGNAEQRLLTSHDTDGSRELPNTFFSWALSGGFYLVRVSAPNGTWSQKVMACLNQMGSFSYNEFGVGLEVPGRIRDCKIDEEKLRFFFSGVEAGLGLYLTSGGTNKYPLLENNAPDFYGYLDYPYTCGGRYSFKLTNGGSMDTDTRSVDVPANPLGHLQDAVKKWYSPPEKNFSYLYLDEAEKVITGGYYDPDRSDPSKNEFKPKLDYAILELESLTEDLDYSKITNWTTPEEIAKLELDGYYILAVRSQDKTGSGQPTVYAHINISNRGTGAARVVSVYGWDAQAKQLTHEEQRHEVYAFDGKLYDGFWYTIGYKNQFDGRITVRGTSNLIIDAGTTVTVDGDITIPEGCTLNVYGSGTLDVTDGFLGSGTLAIHGATVIGDAFSGSNAGIGCSLNMYSGTIHATGGTGAPGIGSADSIIALYGGTVNARGGNIGSGILAKQLSIYGSTGTAWGKKADNISAGELYVEPNRVKLADDRSSWSGAIPVQVTRYTWDEANRKLVPTTETQYASALQEGTTTLEDGIWYTLDKDVTISHRLSVNGTANLVLPAGMTLEAKEGINVAAGDTLNIFGDGTLTANSVNNNGIDVGAAIGCSEGDKSDLGIVTGGSVNIYGGEITAIASDNHAGIGSGDRFGTINIYAGTVNATGGRSGAGIGRGHQESGYNEGGWPVGTVDDKPYTGYINIYGGTVNAHGGWNAAGIGAGSGGGYGILNCNTINIRGGTIHAVGGLAAPGIGGNLPADEKILIDGGSGTSQSETGDVYINAGGGKVEVMTLYVTMQSDYSAWTERHHERYTIYSWDKDNKVLNSREVYEELTSYEEELEWSYQQYQQYVIKHNIYIAHDMEVDEIPTIVGDRIDLVIPEGVTLTAKTCADLGYVDTLRILGGGTLNITQGRLSGTSAEVELHGCTVNIRPTIGEGLNVKSFTVYKGSIDVTGGEKRAGIYAGTMNCYGGNVVATGGTGGAGISGSTLTLCGGSGKATGGSGAENFKTSVTADPLLVMLDQANGKWSPAEPHEHTWSIAWQRDQNGHWKSCTQCVEIGSYAAHTYSDKGICSVCGFRLSQDESIQNTATLSLNGTIAANIYVDVAAYAEKMRKKPEDFTVVLTYNHNTDNYGTDRTREEFDVSDDYKAADGRYLFTCPVVSAQIMDKIDVALKLKSNTIWRADGYSVAKYCENQIANSTDARLIALCKAILNYGGYAQVNFGYRADEPVNAGKDFEHDVDSAKEPVYSAAAKGEATDFTLLGATFLALSDSSIRLYYALENGRTAEDFDFEIKTNAKVSRMEWKRGDTGTGGYGRYIEIFGIESANLDATIQVRIRNRSDESTMIVQYNPLDYAASKWNDEDEKLTNFCRAMVLYNQASNDYFDNREEST